MSLALDILHGSPDLLASDRRGRLSQLLVVVIVAGLFYGALMGTFSGLSAHRFLQIAYSAVKVPLLLLLTFIIALPSFFVLNSLLGLRDDFHLVLRALLATQAGLTLILASLAPFTVFWYASCADYQAAILFNALMFGIASISAQRLLRRHYALLAARNPRHRSMQRLWLGLFAFVGIQLGWVLRPFVGDPQTPTGFFRNEAWGNAYVHIGGMLWDVLRRVAG